MKNHKEIGEPLGDVHRMRQVWTLGHEKSGPVSRRTEMPNGSDGLRPSRPTCTTWSIGWRSVESIRWPWKARVVYWIPVFEILEARGFQVYLRERPASQECPGAEIGLSGLPMDPKAAWLGLLASSFRPDAEMCRLRGYLRHRAQLVQHRAPHILHLQKALQQMNIQLPQVLTDVVGTTGQAILRAIVAGERDAVRLAQLRHPACHSSEDTIAKA